MNFEYGLSGINMPYDGIPYLLEQKKMVFTFHRGSYVLASVAFQGKEWVIEPWRLGYGIKEFEVPDYPIG
jgi:hypothetical protein